MMKIFVRLTLTFFFSHSHIKQILSKKWSGKLCRKILARNWIDQKPNYFPFIRKFWIMFGLVLSFRLINHLHHGSDSFESLFIFNARTQKYNKHRKKISFKQIFTLNRIDYSHEFKFKRIIGMSVNNEHETFQKCKTCKMLLSLLNIVH